MKITFDTSKMKDYRNRDFGAGLVEWLQKEFCEESTCEKCPAASGSCYRHGIPVEFWNDLPYVKIEE